MTIPMINISMLNGSNGFRLDGPGGGVYASSVNNAGDINGDGFDDVVVNLNSSYRYAYSASYMVLGKGDSFSNAINLFNLDGENGFRLANRGYSLSVNNAGDMNGDGFDDLIVNTRSTDYVVFGKASGFDARSDLLGLDGSNGFSVHGVMTTDNSDFSVSSAGDFNGDGYGDLIIGDSLAGFNGKSSGSSYVVFGNATGFGASLNLSSLNGNTGFRLDGVATYDGSGFFVSSAGDVNGDGFDDVIIGAPGAGSNGDTGSSYVVFGRASGFAAKSNLSNLDGTNGFRLDGEITNDYSISSVSSAGDVNGDGFNDVIVGARAIDSKGENSGSSYVVFGRSSGFAATLDLANLNGSNGFRMDGEATNDFFGTSVSSAGDFNGDGFDDVIVGAPGAGTNGHYSGSSYVVFGRASGFAATLDLSALDGNNGFRVNGLVDAIEGYDLGSTVSSAGDVNGDGFDDLIIGVSNAPGYVLFGGNFFNEAIYLGTPENDYLVGTELAERFEGGAGDDRMNGLGGADVFDGGIGIDTLVLSGSGINLNLADYHNRINGIETIDLTGGGGNTLTFDLEDLLSLSDTTNTYTVNGNGEDRVAGLADGWTDSGVDGDYRVFTNSGTTLRVHLAVHTDAPIPGVINLADLNGNNGFRVNGASESAQYGRSISDAGDINGDGFDDVIIGAPKASFSNNYSGASYVIFGKASGFDATVDLASLDGSNGFRLDGAANNDYSGKSVSSAGDVNGDGFDDLLIGAPYADPLGSYSDAGSSYVVFGRASSFDAAMNLSSVDGSNGFRLDGAAEGDISGKSVSNAGDVNGDGFDDVIIGALYADTNGSESGSSYVVFGKPSGFDTEMNLSSLDGSNGFRLDGVEANDKSGLLVSNAGDVNGDGCDDVIIGTSRVFSKPSSSYVVFGKDAGFSAAMNLSSLDGNNGFRLDSDDGVGFGFSSISNAGDINGDGYDDLIIGANVANSNGLISSGSSYVVFGKAAGFDATLNLSSLDGSNGFRLDGGAESDLSGSSVSSAGDVNGDGFDDLIVGASYTDPLGRYSDAGSSYVVFGRASGFDAAMNLSSLDGGNGIRLDGSAERESSGSSVSSAGDVNGDGYEDLLVGSPRANLNGFYSGSSYVIFGRSDFGGGNVIEGTAGNDILKGTLEAEIFEAGDGNDRMIGRGGADVFHGDAGDDYIQVTDLGFSSVDGGSGNDVLNTDGKDLNLDLTDYLDKIKGIETICLYGRGDNTLTLTGSELKALSDTTDTLKVHGNAGDKVILEGNWVDESSHGFYHTYTQDDAVLLVGMNMTAVFA